MPESAQVSSSTDLTIWQGEGGVVGATGRQEYIIAGQTLSENFGQGSHFTAGEKISNRLVFRP